MFTQVRAALKYHHQQLSSLQKQDTVRQKRDIKYEFQWNIFSFFQKKNENEERTFLQQTTDRHNKHASRELEDSTQKKWDKGSHCIHPNVLNFSLVLFHTFLAWHSSFNKRAHQILIYFKGNLVYSHRSLTRSAANSLLIRILTRLSAVSVRIVNLFLGNSGWKEWEEF